MAQPTVSINGAPLARIRLLGGLDLRCLVLVTVMPEMAGIFPSLMLAISPHRRPAKLKRHKYSQKEGNPKTHVQKYTGRCFNSDVNCGGLTIRFPKA